MNHVAFMYKAKLALYENVIFLYKAPTISIQSVRPRTFYTERNSKLKTLLTGLFHICCVATLQVGHS